MAPRLVESVAYVSPSRSRQASLHKRGSRLSPDLFKGRTRGKCTTLLEVPPARRNWKLGTYRRRACCTWR